MKRTISVLASLAAIALLSCSSLDNSNSLSEDVNLPQANALAKAATSAESLDKDYVDPGIGTRANGSVSATANTPLTVTAPNGSTGSSTVLTFNFPNISQPTARITNVEICANSSTVTGNFTVQSLWVSCSTPTGSRIATIPFSGMCTTSSAFNGLSIPTSCSISYSGKCNSGGPCKKTLSNWRFTVYYQY